MCASGWVRLCKLLAHPTAPCPRGPACPPHPCHTSPATLPHTLTRFPFFWDRNTRWSIRRGWRNWDTQGESRHWKLGKGRSHKERGSRGLLEKLSQKEEKLTHRLAGSSHGGDQNRAQQTILRPPVVKNNNQDWQRVTRDPVQQ